jgi:hypothetical protein
MHMSRYKVTKHGTMHVSKHEMIFCPECASEIIKSDRKSEVDYVFFRLIKRTKTYRFIKCPECGCEMQKIEKTRMKPCILFRKILTSILLIFLTTFIFWFTIYAVTHDSGVKTWLGVLGVLSIFVTIFMSVLDIYYIGDILEHIHIYKEY